MYSPFRRHDKFCKYASRGRSHFRCGCPIYADNNTRGAGRSCKSLGTRDWDEAGALVIEWNKNGERPAKQPTTILEAIEVFKESMTLRQLKTDTIAKYERLFMGLRSYAAAQNLSLISQLDVETLQRFRATWTDKNLTAVKKLDRLKAFGRFSVEMGWLTTSPAAPLRAPKTTPAQTQPYSDEEILRLLTTVETMVAEAPDCGRANMHRLRALVLFLRYSGLRIGDAVSCSTDRLRENRLRIYTQKTGQHVHIALPDFVIRALELTPRQSDRFWWWTGTSKLRTASTHWQTRLHELGRRAKISRLHAHRFRDTFAVKLLLDGTPLERVSVLLGHSSIRVTEKHYSPWIRDRQEQAEEDVRRSWQRDALYLLESDASTQRPS